MPLFKGRCFSPVKAVSTVGSKDTVYVIPHTNEQFLSKEEYDRRVALYNDAVWTCQCTGTIKLTHKEAVESEQKSLRFLSENFPVVFEKSVLELVHLSTNSLDRLVDRASKRLYEQLVIGERVKLRVTSQGTALRGVIVKMDTSSTNDKLNGSLSSASEDSSAEEQTENLHKKMKLLPYKYGVKLDGSDTSIVSGIPATDLIRETRVPNKDLLKLFIRAHAVRSTNVINGPWIVEENYVRKHSLSFSTPNKNADAMANGSAQNCFKLANGDCSTGKQKSSSSSRKKPADKSSPKKPLSPTNLSKKFGSGGGGKSPRSQKRKRDDDSDSEMPLSELQNCASDDEDIALAKLKQAKKKRLSKDVVDSDDDDEIVLAKLKKDGKPKVKRVRKGKSEVENQLDSSDEEDIALAELKKKQTKSTEKSDVKGSKKATTSGDKSPKKKLKQVTLFQMKGMKKMVDKDKVPASPSKSKGQAQTTPKKTPSKSKSPAQTQSAKKSPMKATPAKSPYRLPVIVARLKKSLKEGNKAVSCQLLSRCCKELTAAQVKSLPDDMKAIIEPKFEKLLEKKKIAAMDPAEREEYLKKKKEEMKQKNRERMKQKWADAKRRYEDTELDLKPLPPPTIVSTPDGLANELFGDVVMVTQFINCYKSLLMPDSSLQITADNLMKALVSGRDGFEYLSKVLVVILQTLLQDQLAEDYKELSSALSELPVNDYTASELVRLCLRHHDVDDDGSDEDDEKKTKLDMVADDEVPADVVEQLETSELYELDACDKLQILVGLCHRVMSSYSVQDYMDEKQQESAELWKKRIAGQKLQKDLRKDTKKEGKKKVPDEQKPINAAKSTLESMLEQSKPASAAESIDGEDDDEDMVSVIKRRRLNAAKAAEDKRRKELEDKLLREKEYNEQKQLREKEAFEKTFKDGILMAKIALRWKPLGLDRNHDRYWFFPSAAPGVYVEKGWANEDVNYTVCSKASTSISTSESDSETEGCGRNFNKTLPHTGQNLWFVLDSVADIEQTCENLHALGARESSLKDELKKNMDSIVKALTKTNRSPNDAEVKCEGDFMVEGTRQELQDLEVRLRHGGLGGVQNFEAWNQKLAAAMTVKEFAECLLETQAFILERFVTGMMAKDTKKKAESVDETESGAEDDAASNADSGAATDKKTSDDGLAQWLESVAQCSTLSRLHVLTGILESCVKWEKSAENAKCKICRKKGEEEDHLLLCDECNQPFHLYCLRPALYEVPSGEWFCPVCSPERSIRRCRTVVHKYEEEEDEDDSEKDEGISEDIEHERICTMCGEEGELVECSTCPSSFHMDCHDPPLRHIPRQNTWKCVQCRTGIRIRKSSRRIKANQSRKRPKYSEDTETEEEEDYLPTKKSSSTRSSRSQSKRASDADTSRSRSTRNSLQDTSQSSEPELRGRDSLGSRTSRSRVSKENRCTDGDKEAILSIIDKLKKHRQSWPYHEPVDRDCAPDYYEMIKNPVDLQTMEDRCLSDVYTSPQKFLDDFALMMNNALQYNEVDSPVYKTIEPFEKYFEPVVKHHLPNYTYRRR